jgi:hypothetical protein
MHALINDIRAHFPTSEHFMFDISIRDPMGAAAKPSGLPLSFVVNGLKGQ